MSAHGHATPGDADTSHDHHYEGIPADRPGPDEPHTPLWLPLVGIGLFLLSLLAYVITRPPAKTGAELAKEAAPPTPAAEPVAAASASAPAPRARRMPPGFASALPGAQAPGTPSAGAARPAGSAPRPMPRLRPMPGASAGAQPAPGSAPAR